jgi:hypothetical protein
MNFEKTFIVSQSELVVSERVKAFLEGAGYHEVSASPISYKRGSMIGSLTSFSPRKWQARALIEIEPLAENQTKVVLNLDVNTKGQMVSQKEIAYWQSEVESYEQAVSTGEVHADILNESLGELAKSGKKGLLLFVGVGIGVGIPAALIAGLINPSFSRAGVVVGVTAGLAAARKHWGN